MRLIPLAALSVTLCACAGTDPVPSVGGDGETGADRREADADGDALVRRIFEYGLGFGESRTSIRESLGEPQRVDTALAENRHVPSATDSLFTLVYDGLRFELIRPGPVERDLLTSVTLSDPGREIPGGFGVGATRSTLTRLLGGPDESLLAERGTILTYRAPGTVVDQFVEFLIVADTVRHVRWLPYVD